MLSGRGVAAVAPRVPFCMPTAEPLALQVLIPSEDPLAAALRGLLVELLDLTPAFADASERPEEALTRVRPRAVVVLDGALPAAGSELFSAAAARAEIALAVFGTPRHAPESARRAAARGMPNFDVPGSFETFDAVLRETRRARWWLRGAELRQSLTTLPGDLRVGGSVVFVDADGRSWRIYDRRGSERRRGRDAAVVRMFVSDAAEIRASRLAADETTERSVEQLAVQLARARPE